MKKSKTKGVDLFAARQAETDRAVTESQALKASVRAKLRKERQAQEAQDAAPEAPIGATLAEVKAKLEAGSSVTPTQMASALAKDQIASLQSALDADKEAIALKARRERAVQVASDARDVFQIARDEARERAFDAFRQVALQLEADLRAAFAPVQASRREMKATGVSDYTISTVGVSSYVLSVDVEDVIERASDTVRRMSL